MKRLILVCVLLIVPGITLAGSLPDTGQTKCYDADGVEIDPCPSPGEDFYGQDANYAPCNPHSYTTLGGGIMVQDNVTGLIWEVKQDKDGTKDYENPHDADNTYIWYDGDTGTPGDGETTFDTQQHFIDVLNYAEFGGHSDWRLPTVKELSTLVDSNIPSPGPTINTDYFPNSVSSNYWSSTTVANFPLGAWYVYFSYGYVYYAYKSNCSYYVRAVRTGQSGSFGDFVDNGDGTVTDTDTGLMWQQDTAPGTYTWEQAISYCEDLTFPPGGYSDWRLPNRNELQSIVDYSRYGLSIDPIFNTVSYYYWSATTDAYDLSSAWYVYFGGGGVNYSHKSNDGLYVRAVRARQCESTTIPTLTEWGIIIFMTLIMGIGVVVLRRRRMA